MGKYKVYFNIKSKGLCRGIKNSGLNDNIDEALELIDFLMRYDDSIYLITQVSGFKTGIYLESTH